MPYIRRSHDGSIHSIAQDADDNHTEYLQPTSPELAEFLGDNSDISNTKQTLAESDGDIARVTEDLIDLLIQKNLILFTELPKPVQEKLLTRAKLRSHLNKSDFNFLDDSESL